jgi:hypothetical protein
VNVARVALNRNIFTAFGTETELKEQLGRGYKCIFISCCGSIVGLLELNS